LLLDSSGNLGLGVTPSTWGSNLKAIQIGDYAAFANNVSTASAIVASNAYNNDNTNWRYSFSSVAAARYEATLGAHKWYNAPSGTAGNAITFTQAMTLDASGNLGLGVTPSAWTSTYKAIDVTSRTSFVGTTGGLSIFSNNSYFDGTNWIYRVTDAASRYQQDTSAHKWFIAASGTAGNAITFTQAMTLNASGNLGIGTSSPSASAILDAQSTTKGVRMPNMTTTQKNAIASPAAGLMVYDTTLAKLCVYTTAWETITSL
jgi:hypothetical protein